MNFWKNLIMFFLVGFWQRTTLSKRYFSITVFSRISVPQSIPRIERQCQVGHPPSNILKLARSTPLRATISQLLLWFRTKTTCSDQTTYKEFAGCVQGNWNLKPLLHYTMVCLSRPYPFKFFKGCLPQNLLSPLLNLLSHLKF